MSAMAQACIGTHGERIALKDVAVSATLQDLLSIVTISQTYHNQEDRNIEAVYTFPLPLDAVLLDLEVEIGGRKLKGLVVEKTSAEEKYEKAIEGGDSAVMLEAIEPGLYTMNVGNLMSKELATITFKYAMLYSWAGDQLRFFLPTTIAPRYGASPHQPHQVPEHSLTVENRFSLEVNISGDLRNAQFSCPSHAVSLAKSADHTVISLQQAQAVMDRDFILNVKAPNSNRSFAICGVDGTGSAVVASFKPFFPGLQHHRPLNLVVLIDCSGSMGGDSMAQAKQALAGMIDALHPDDQVTFIAFGSDTKPLSKKLLPCKKSNLEKMKSFTNSLDADMGGTEIGSALQHAYAVTRKVQHADIFLITDGEVGSWQQVVNAAKNSGKRIFTVGVGSAVSEAFVREIASETGGHCELVTPREGMADRVIRHFERMRAARAKQVSVQWPEGAHGIAPFKQSAVFEGDTLVASAQFTQPFVDSKVALEVITEEGDVFQQEVQITKATNAGTPAQFSTVARVAAAFRLKEFEDVSGSRTAVQYQLVSPWTNWLVVAERPEDEKAQDIPELRTVPQTLAAGWGGTGGIKFSRSSGSHVDSSASYLDQPVFCRNMTDSSDSGAELCDLAVMDLHVSDTSFSLPMKYTRLFELICEDSHSLRPDNAMSLLAQAGLLSEFQNLFDFADRLELELNVIATIILEKLLLGSLGEQLPDSIHNDLAGFQSEARQMTKSLKAISLNGRRWAEAIEQGIKHGVLSPAEMDRPIMQTLDYYDGLLELLSDLEGCESTDKEVLIMEV